MRRPFSSWSPLPAFAAVCLFPTVVLLTFAAFALRARIELGRWPIPYSPDPKALGYFVQHAALWYGLLGLFVAPIVVLGLYATLQPKGSRGRGWAALFVAQWIVTVALLYFDPGRLLEWFLD
jgi:hypothetical protein